MDVQVDPAMLQLSQRADPPDARYGENQNGSSFGDRRASAQRSVLSQSQSVLHIAADHQMC